MRIKNVTLSELGNLRQMAESDGILFSPNVLLWAAFDQEIITGFVGAIVTRASVTMKCAWVHPAHRGKGVYQKLSLFRETQVPKVTWKSHATAMSYKAFLKRGYVVERQYKNGIRLMVKRHGHS